jgi:hypothetical protein
MFTFPQLRELARTLRNRKVLSVFVDTSATGEGSSWREELQRALAGLDAMPPHLSRAEGTARALCMAHLWTALEGMRGVPGRPAWVAYVTTDDVVAAGPVPARLETGAFWQNGVVVAPLLSEVAAPGVVALADIVAEEVAEYPNAAVAGTRAPLRYPLANSPNAGRSSQAAPA